METLWFWLLALMLTIYVLLDGFDLGAGVVSLLVASSDDEKRQILRSIGPVWDGNEVWLLAAGGTLFFAFPTLYAVSFSGFYLPLMLVLWLLIARGVALELRDHLGGPLWSPFWDFVFGAGSGLLALFLGTALGNVVRGVPLEPSGYFFLPLWTDFGFGAQGLASGGILDWYTLSVGVLALTALTMHGAMWVILKTTGELQRKAAVLASKAYWANLGLLAVVTALSFKVQPQLAINFGLHAWGWGFPLLALTGLAVLFRHRRGNRPMAAFLGSCAYLAGLLGAAAFGLFPWVLPSLSDPSLGLTVRNAAADGSSLRIGLTWWIPGMILTTGYFVYAYASFSGKVEAGNAHHREANIRG